MTEYLDTMQQGQDLIERMESQGASDEAITRAQDALGLILSQLSEAL